MKMSKKLAEDFCDHVCGEDAELYYEAFCQWAAKWAHSSGPTWLSK
jgi:hypothetical protein